MASEGNGVKVIELQAYCDWKQGVFPEASNNLTWSPTAKIRCGSTKYTTSYILHNSALEEVLIWFCYRFVNAEHPKVVYTHSRTERSPHVTGNPPKKNKAQGLLTKSGSFSGQSTSTCWRIFSGWLGVDKMIRFSESWRYKTSQALVISKIWDRGNSCFKWHLGLLPIRFLKLSSQKSDIVLQSGRYVILWFVY